MKRQLEYFRPRAVKRPICFDGVWGIGLFGAAAILVLQVVTRNEGIAEIVVFGFLALVALIIGLELGLINVCSKRRSVWGIIGLSLNATALLAVAIVICRY